MHPTATRAAFIRKTPCFDAPDARRVMPDVRCFLSVDQEPPFFLKEALPEIAVEVKMLLRTDEEPELADQVQKATDSFTYNSLKHSGVNYFSNECGHFVALDNAKHFDG